MIPPNAPTSAQHVMTVLGPVAPDTIGPTLMHEHLFLDSRSFWRPSISADPALGNAQFDARYNGLGRWNGGAIRDNLHLSPDEFETMVEEVKAFGAAGGDCLVELTIHGIHPSPAHLQALARELDLHIVEGCGFYVHDSHPEWVETASVEELVDFIEREVCQGVDGTTVRPGIIGEIGTSEALFPCEERILRAAARVAVATGTAVNVHCNPPPREVALRIIDILIEEGLDPARIYLSHLDEIADRDYHIDVMKRGVTIGFDSYGQEGYFTPTWRALSDLEKMQNMVALIERGFEDQLVVAQDVCKKHHLHRYGGMGYDHVLTRIVPRLREVFGIDQAIIEKLLVGNPRQLLTRSGATLS